MCQFIFYSTIFNYFTPTVLYQSAPKPLRTLDQMDCCSLEWSLFFVELRFLLRGRTQATNLSDLKYVLLSHPLPSGVLKAKSKVLKKQRIPLNNVEKKSLKVGSDFFCVGKIY